MLYQDIIKKATAIKLELEAQWLRKKNAKFEEYLEACLREDAMLAPDRGRPKNK